MKAFKAAGRIREAYQTLTSYFDSGVVIKKKPGRRERTNKLAFSTFFRSPGSFSLRIKEFLDDDLLVDEEGDFLDEDNELPDDEGDALCDDDADDRNGQQADDILLWSNLKEWIFFHRNSLQEDFSDISRLLRFSRGMTCGLSAYVPMLLHQLESDFLHTDFAVEPDLRVGNYDCQCIAAVNGQDQVQIYFEKNAFFIRRIVKDVIINPESLFEKEQFEQVSSDLSEAGADPRSVLSPYRLITEVNYEIVNPDIGLDDQVFNRPTKF